MKHHNLLRFISAAALLALLAGMLSPVPVTMTAFAASLITVTTQLDTLATDGVCSLREAIIAANKDQASSNQPGECPAGAGVDTIVLPPGNYLLTRTDQGKEDSSATGDLDITDNLSLVGAGAGQTVIAGSQFTDRIFHILSGSHTISGVTIRSGSSRLDGGGIYNAGQLTLTQVQITGNQSTGRGGAVYNAPQASLTIQYSTLSGNQAADGGGIAHMGSRLELLNTTLSGNQAAKTGGGLYNNAPARLNNITLAQNTAQGPANGPGGGGIFQAGGLLEISNTILAGNRDLSARNQAPDCAGTIQSLGHNLVEQPAGCTLAGSPGGNLSGVPALLGPLQLNGGATPTHALLDGSSAINAGSPLAPGSSPAACQLDDQRGIARPQGPACDTGAYELEQQAEIDTFTVNTNEDLDGLCTLAVCSLRQAIESANQHPNLNGPDRIIFAIPGADLPMIQPTSPLPAIREAVEVDGTSQGAEGVVVDGTQAGEAASGLAIDGDANRIRGLEVRGFANHGILIQSGSGNVLVDNRIHDNGGAGIAALPLKGNTFLSNAIFANGGLGIDLGADGVTPESPPAAAQNYPALISVPTGMGAPTQGRLSGLPDTTYTLAFFSNSQCDPSDFGEGENPAGTAQVTTGADGTVYFEVQLPQPPSPGALVSATATGPDGSTSEFARCVVAGPRNDSWPAALDLPNPVLGESASQYLDRPGQSRWYRFPVTPGSRVIVTLTGLTRNYDLTLYKDISAAFNQADTLQDLTLLGAEFAPDAFAPDAFSPDAFAPDAFAPDAFAPDAFAADAFSPDAFAPDAFAPDAFAPDAFAPDAFAPDAFAPDAFAPDAFAPDAYAPDAFAPDAFASAQTRSLIGISAFEGTASEGITTNTWENSGFFYIRVRSRNGAYDLQNAFHLQVIVLPGVCGGVSSAGFPASTYPVAAGGYRTIILADFSRQPGSSEALAALQTQLQTFADRDEVAGVIVDVSKDTRVAAANQQADANPQCPTAKNLAAYAIKEIVDGYAAENPLEYIVILGDDRVIPFFRHPDLSNLANERNFVPPVRGSSPSQASLRLGYILSQDRYGSSVEVSHKVSSLPLPGLAIGRLVGLPETMSVMLSAYLATAAGVVPTPTNPLVTGYDFLSDIASAVADNLEAGLGQPVTRLIQPREDSPASPNAWTADDLRDLLLNSRHDLIFLAGHFSPSSTLAADYKTRLVTSELVDASADLTNVFVFSPGCHSAYSIVPDDAIPGVTRLPDWAEAFNLKGATLLGGTAYQYGDTDFIEYNERLYLAFSRQLRYGEGPVAFGKALMEAKQDYLAGTAVMRGIHEKSVLQATLYGLPMLSIDFPSGRMNSEGYPALNLVQNPFPTNPGLTLGLQYVDVSLPPSTQIEMTHLTNPQDGSVYQAVHLSADQGTASNPGEPVLPLVIYNAGAPGTVLRGAGFRGGSYQDMDDILLLTGAATTEIRAVHAAFNADVFYPIKLWQINHFPALQTNSAGESLLMLTPAQYRSSEPGSLTGTLRAFDRIDLRLYYSANTTRYPTSGNQPALAAAPVISRIESQENNGSLNFRVQVVGDLSAGIQETWITYTIPGSGTWQPFDLARSSFDSSVWEGLLPLNGVDPSAVRFIVQSANGVGLVTMLTNQGAFYTPGMADPTIPTSLALVNPPASGPYGTRALFQARLTADGQPLVGKPVYFGLGSARRLAITDGNGYAATALPLAGLAGEYRLQAIFPGDGTYIGSAEGTRTFTITRQETQIELSGGGTVHFFDPSPLSATLTDAAGFPVLEKTLFFRYHSDGFSAAETLITDYAGRAAPERIHLPAGTYTVDVYFSGEIPLEPEPLRLSDPNYNQAAASGTIEVLAREVGLAYTGDLAVEAGEPLRLSAELTRLDNAPVDLSLGQARFRLESWSGESLLDDMIPFDQQGKAAVEIAPPPAGVHTLTVEVTGGFLTAQPVTLLLAAVDLNEPRIQGNAQVSVPTGSFPAAPGLSGSASFAFHAGYLSVEDTRPQGETQLIFQAGDFNFHSDGYDWLVIDGEWGILTGFGSVNSTSGYRFLLSAVDGNRYNPSQPDRFRIRIVEAATGLVVFDNEPGAPLLSVPQSAINNGVIMIHWPD